MTLREWLNAVIRRAGYVLERFEPQRDALLHQKTLLGGRTDAVIFDVGAHTGQSVKRYRHIMPHARIYSFEPFAPSFEKLRDRYAGDPRVTPRQVALGARDGRAELHVNAFTQTNSLLPAATDVGQWSPDHYYKTVERREVDITTVDQLMREYDIAVLDILKMDTQGTEIDVLRGAVDALAAGRIRLVYSEVEFVHLYENQALFHDMDRHMQKAGYELCGIYNLSHNPRGRLIVTDALWAHRDQLSGK